MNLIDLIIDQRKEALGHLFDFNDDKSHRLHVNQKLDEHHLAANSLRSEIIPPYYQRTDDTNQGWNREAYSQAVDWFAELYNGNCTQRGLILYGDTEGCKTRILYCLAALFLIERGIRPRIYRPGVLHTHIEASIRHECDSMMDILQTCCDTRVLMIDDLGKETMTPRYQAFLFEVIEHRIAFEKPTVITMNHSGSEFLKKLENTRNADPLLIQPLIRRLRESFTTIQCLTRNERAQNNYTTISQ